MNKKLSYKINNLHCGGCASKVEEGLNKEPYIKKATINFMTKTLYLELLEDRNNLFTLLNKAIDKIEPGVTLKDTPFKDTNKENNILGYNFKVENLHCGGCASKIEEAIKKLPYIETANLNFMKKTLKISLIKSKAENKNWLEEIRELAEKLESGTKIIEASNNLDKETEYIENTAKIKEGTIKNYKEEIKLFLSLSLFFLGIFRIESETLKLIVFAIAYIISGGHVITKSFKNITRGNFFDENFLMTIATFGAIFIGEYSEAVAVMIFYQVGEYFQGRAVNNSRRSIEGLMDIRPDFANIKLNDIIKKVKPESVEIDSIIVIKPGEKIPLDGVVTTGNATLDTSALTGESLPLDVNIGDKVLSGSINKNGVIEVKVEKDFYNSTVNKILELVENASNKKAETEKFITKFAKYYTPTVVVIATLVAIVPPIFVGGFNEWLYRALIFLVISCPCALVISIPLGFFSGIGAASKEGILVKGGNYLEALNKVTTIVFDKTGTITKGNFEVTEVITKDITKDKLVYIAAYGESYSNHPIAKSIVKYYKKTTNKEIDFDLVLDYKEIEGYGVSFTLNEDKVLLGNYKLMMKENISCSEEEKIGTLVYVGVNGEYKGVLVISDQLKEDSITAIKKLKELNIKTFMLTGDNQKVADSIGKLVNIDSVYGGLLPNQKVERFEEIQKNENGNIIFVGDGINDAPVLARADIGVAMGGIGSDAAIEAADMVIMTDELTKLHTSIKISKTTRKIVTQNIILALGIKLIVMTLGIGGVATMWEAIFADVGVSILAIFNSIRILKKKYN